MKSGTVAALKALFSAQRTVTLATVLRPADQGRLILADGAGINVTLPPIGGVAGVQNALGPGWACVILNLNAGGCNIVNAADTFNGSQAFAPINLAAVNTFAICVVPPTGTDWSILAGIPGAL